MNRITTAFIITAIAAFLWNCSERIELELDSTYTRLVIEGSVTTDTMAHWVRLSTSSDYFYNQLAPAVLVY